MIRVAGILAVAFSLSQHSCLVDFPFPLDTPAHSSIDAQLLGQWTCRVNDTDETFVLTMLDFDGKQYYMGFTADGEEAEHLRAYATTLQATTILNMVFLGDDEQDGWHYALYSFPEPGMLEIRIVRVEPFKDVHESREEVRRLLARNIDNKDFYDAPLSCVRENCEDQAAEPEDAPDEGREEDIQ